MFAVAGLFFFTLLFLLPHGGFALLAACSAVAAIIGALETGTLLAASGQPVTMPVAAACGASLPAAAYADNMMPHLGERAGERTMPAHDCHATHTGRLARSAQDVLQKLRCT